MLMLGSTLSLGHSGHVGFIDEASKHGEGECLAWAMLSVTST